MKKGRSYESAVADLEVLADGLGVERFFVAGVSGGGPYALAAGAIIPGRLRGILLLSAVGPDSTPLLPYRDPDPPPPPRGCRGFCCSLQLVPKVRLLDPPPPGVRSPAHVHALLVFLITTIQAHHRQMLHLNENAGGRCKEYQPASTTSGKVHYLSGFVQLPVWSDVQRKRLAWLEAGLRSQHLADYTQNLASYIHSPKCGEQCCNLQEHLRRNIHRNCCLLAALDAENFLPPTPRPSLQQRQKHVVMIKNTSAESSNVIAGCVQLWMRRSLHRGSGRRGWRPACGSRGPWRWGGGWWRRTRGGGRCTPCGWRGTPAPQSPASPRWTAGEKCEVLRP